MYCFLGITIAVVAWLIGYDLGRNSNEAWRDQSKRADEAEARCDKLWSAWQQAEDRLAYTELRAFQADVAEEKLLTIKKTIE